MDLPTFRATFPEFSTAPDALVTLFLANAAQRTDASTWGAKYDQGHGYLAAHMLASAPNGQFARLLPKTGESTYGEMRKQLEREVTMGLRNT